VGVHGGPHSQERLAFDSTGVHGRPLPSAWNGSQLGSQEQRDTTLLWLPPRALSYYDMTMWKSIGSRASTASTMLPSATPSNTPSRSSISTRMPIRPRVLAIGPDRAANLLEIIWLELADGVELVIHAMSLRPKFYDLLPKPKEDTP